MAAGMRLPAWASATETERLRARLLLAAGAGIRDAGAAMERVSGQLRLLSPASAARQLRYGMESLASRLEAAGPRLLDPFRTALGHAGDRLGLLSPWAILKRGYSIAAAPGGKIIKSSSEVSPGDCIRLVLAEGSLTAKVTTTETG
jgi:exodeoxyribonuclease VII large subunit